MFSRLSNFSGPLSRFSSGSLGEEVQPNLLLSLDSFDYDLYFKLLQIANEIKPIFEPMSNISLFNNKDLYDNI
jgi:hypothetical protein